MSEPFLGEIRMFGGNFAPRNWALCNGQLLPISQNAALFSIIGTTYGGNGTTNFQLPNLQGRLPMHWGNGLGLSQRVIGESAGTENVSVLLQNMPAHNHTAVFTPTGNPTQINATATVGTFNTPAGNMLAQAPTGSAGNALIFAPPDSPVSGQLAGVSGGGGGGTIAVGLNGSGTPISVVQPFLAVTFIIALAGIFPSRN